MIADIPLVKNLENPDYMKIILGEKKTLEEVFALIDTAEVSQRLKESRTTDDSSLLAAIFFNAS